MVQSPLVQYGGGVERKVPGWHSMDNTVPRLLERHFPERIPPTERKSIPTKRCVVCYNNKRKETVFSCPDCEANLCWGLLQDLTHEAEIYSIYKNFSV
jgi:hypothetical protein